MASRLEIEVRLAAWFAPWAERYMQESLEPDMGFVLFMARVAMTISGKGG